MCCLVFHSLTVPLAHSLTLSHYHSFCLCLSLSLSLSISLFLTILLCLLSPHFFKLTFLMTALPVPISQLCFAFLPRPHDRYAKGPRVGPTMWRGRGLQNLTEHPPAKSGGRKMSQEITISFSVFHKMIELNTFHILHNHSIFVQYVNARTEQVKRYCYVLFFFFLLQIEYKTSPLKDRHFYLKI